MKELSMRTTRISTSLSRRSVLRASAVAAVTVALGAAVLPGRLARVAATPEVRADLMAHVRARRGVVA